MVNKNLQPTFLVLAVVMEEVAMEENMAVVVDIMVDIKSIGLDWSFF